MLVDKMAYSRTCGSTGSTIYYTFCKIAGQLPTNGTLFEINGVAGPMSKELDIFSAWEDIENI